MASELFKKYIWLVDIIHRHGPLTFVEINRRWHQSSLCNGRDLALRTFHNHREAVEEIFRIRIACDDCTNEYYIENDSELGKNNIANWLLNSFSMINMLCESSAMADRVIVEDIPSAQKFMTDLLTAMRENRRVNISYQPFYGDEPFDLEL
ncbi:MAG: WYL domain-containing protein, partial [Alistipes sp.]|nr:WYL domain-containing protein [Alistipes sp.]